MVEFAVIVLASYLLGAVPFGLVMGKLRGIDIREYGSGNIGAANILRTLGWKAAAIVFCADLAKGVMAVLLARFILHSPTAEATCALAALIGHNWSVYIRFRGGRGVTTGLGGLLAMSQPVAGIGLVIFAAITSLSKYVSLGSILGTGCVVIVMAVFVVLGREPVAYLVYCVISVALIIVQHRGNIRRLLAGTEHKLGKRGEKQSEVMR